MKSPHLAASAHYLWWLPFSSSSKLCCSTPTSPAPSPQVVLVHHPNYSCFITPTSPTPSFQQILLHHPNQSSSITLTSPAPSLQAALLHHLNWSCSITPTSLALSPQPGQLHHPTGLVPSPQPALLHHSMFADLFRYFQVLSSCLCSMCLRAHAAETWCEWAQGQG